jgi:hypothetical protein
MKAITRSFVAVASIASMAGCDGCGPAVDPVAGGEVCGSGSIDGTNYSIESSELVIVVRKKDAFGCGALHSHVVQATQATFTYDLDGSAAGEVGIVVAASKLNPDDPDLRLKYLPDNENQPLSDGDRETIRGSVNEEVLASDHPALNFTLKSLSTLDGDGTATLVSDIAGAESEVDLTYTASKDGDNIKIKGSASIDGEPHGIPRNALGFCVEQVMDFEFELVLAPGDTLCDGEIEEIPAFVPTEFPDDACGDVGFNVVYNEVLGPRCMGCHGGTLPDNPDLLRGGATVPLVTWDDFRIDSVRHPDVALYLTAHDFVGRDPFGEEELPMPPSAQGEATALLDLLTPVTVAGVEYTTEKDLFDAWVEVGLGRDAQCADDVEKKTFGGNAGQAIEPGACNGVDVIRYDTPQAAHGDASAEDFFINCTFCHSTGNPAQAPAAFPIASFVDDNDVVNFDAGELPVTHPFYVDSDGDPLSFWEASIHRTEDNSMGPGGGYADFDPAAFDAFKDWVNAGYCPPET